MVLSRCNPRAKVTFLDYNLSLDKKEILKTNNPTNSKKSIIKKDSKQISNFSVADEIKKLKELKDSGAITSEEYETAKKKILNN